MQASLDIHISFSLRRNRPNKNGEFPIIIRILLRNQKRENFTGLYCPEKYWAAEFGKVNPKYGPGITINDRMDKIKRSAELQFERLKFSGEDFTIDQLVDAIKGKNTAPQTLQEYCNERFAEFAKEVNVNIAKTTFYKYKRIIQYINQFIELNPNKNNIPISTLNEDYINTFFGYLRKDKEQSHNSASALMSCLNRLLQPALKSGILKTNPITSKVLSRKQVYRGYLEKEEINSLANLTNLSPHLEEKRDIFLFAVYTGLAYTDLRSLTGSQIRQDADGLYFIEKPRDKSNVLSIIPLLPQATQILLKYSPSDDIRDFKWTLTSNQKMNQGLKELAQLAGIKQKVYMHLARHTFATTITLTNGVSLETVSKMLGHTSLKHTVIYAKVVAQKVKDEMKSLIDKYK